MTIKYIFVLAALGLTPAAAHPQAARVETGDTEPRIVVTATRSTRIQPDRATLYVMIEGSGESPADAAQRGAQKVQAVTAALQPFASGKDALTAVPYGVAPAANLNGYPGSPSQTSFLARFAIRIQLPRIDQITPLAVAAIAAGASSTSPPTFESTATDSVRRLRYAEALSQAQRDAETLASALGGRLGPVLEVSSNTAGNQSFSQGYFSLVSRYEMSGPIQPPDVVVTATVTVRYRFVAK